MAGTAHAAFHAASLDRDKTRDPAPGPPPTPKPGRRMLKFVKPAERAAQSAYLRACIYVIINN